MLGLRSESNLDTGVLPSILVTGQQPTLPGRLVVQRPTIDDASDFGRKLASAMAAQTFHENPWHNKCRGRSCVPHDMWTSKCVLVRADNVQSSLVPKYTGPFRVLRHWKKCSRLQLENREDTVSIDRLRPFYEDETDHRGPVNDVVDTGKSDIIDDHVDDLVVHRSNRTVFWLIRFADAVKSDIIVSGAGYNVGVITMTAWTVAVRRCLLSLKTMGADTCQAHTNSRTLIEKSNHPKLFFQQA